MRLPLQRPFVDPPAPPSPTRSRSRERRGEARRTRRGRRAGSDAPRRPPRVRRADSPGANQPASGAAHSRARGPGPQAPATTAKSGSPARPRSPASPSPPIRRAPPDLARHWREQMAQRPPGSFDVINDLDDDDDEQTPAAPAGAECPIGDMEYPEDWGPMDDWVAAGGGCVGPEPEAAATGGERVPATPRGRTPPRLPESHPAASGSEGPVRPAPDMRRNPLAPVRRGGVSSGAGLTTRDVILATRALGCSTPVASKYAGATTAAAAGAPGAPTAATAGRAPATNAGVRTRHRLARHLRPNGRRRRAPWCEGRRALPLSDGFPKSAQSGGGAGGASSALSGIR